MIDNVHIGLVICKECGHIHYEDFNISRKEGVIYCSVCAGEIDLLPIQANLIPHKEYLNTLRKAREQQRRILSRCCVVE